METDITGRAALTGTFPLLRAQGLAQTVEGWEGVARPIAQLIQQPLAGLRKPDQQDKPGEALFLIQGFQVCLGIDGRRPLQADVVAHPFEHLGHEVYPQILADPLQVIGHLVLEQAGVGGDDYRLALAAGPEDGGDQVGEGLAGAGGGLDGHETVVLERPAHRLDHLKLSVTSPEVLLPHHCLEPCPHRLRRESERHRRQPLLRYGRGAGQPC